MQSLRLNTPIMETFWRKIKILSIIISFVGKVQRSVGILSDICSVCRKIATSCSAYFLTHDAGDISQNSIIVNEKRHHQSDGNSVISLLVIFHHRYHYHHHR